MMMGMGSLVLAAALLGSAGACRCASAPGAIKLDGGACVLPITDGTRTVAASAVLPGVDWTKLTQRDGTPWAANVTQAAGGFLVAKGRAYVLVNDGLGEVDPVWANPDPSLKSTLRGLGCGAPDAVILASLRREQTGWNIEHTYFGGDAPTREHRAGIERSNSERMASILGTGATQYPGPTSNTSTRAPHFATRRGSRR